MNNQEAINILEKRMESIAKRAERIIEIVQEYECESLVLKTEMYALRHAIINLNKEVT